MDIWETNIATCNMFLEMPADKLPVGVTHARCLSIKHKYEKAMQDFLMGAGKGT